MKQHVLKSRDVNEKRELRGVVVGRLKKRRMYVPL